MSLLLAPVAAAAGPTRSTDALLLTSQGLGTGYVVAVTAAAWLLGGPLAAGLAALLIGTAPFAIESGSLLMSDALVAGLTVLIAALLHLARGQSEAAQPQTAASSNPLAPSDAPFASRATPSSAAEPSTSTSTSSPTSAMPASAAPGRTLTMTSRPRLALPPLAVAALVAGCLALLRLSALAALASLMLALPRRTWRWILPFAAPGVLALALFQLSTFGSPIRTGYDYWLPDLRTFDLGYPLQRPMGDTPTMVGDALDGQLLGWLCPCGDDGGPLTQLPNVLFYPAVVFGPFWLFAPPLVGVLGLVYAARHWHEPAARFSVWLSLLSVVLMSAYVFQAARLVAAPAVLLAVYAAVAVGRWLDGGARWPVMYAEAGEASRIAMPFRSSSAPKRRRGMPSRRRSPT
jgi:hypothetical protein